MEAIEADRGRRRGAEERGSAIFPVLSTGKTEKICNLFSVFSFCFDDDELLPQTLAACDVQATIRSIVAHIP